MCKANDKQITQWFRNKETSDLFSTLEAVLGIKSKGGNSHLSSKTRLSASQYTKLFPELIVSKIGTPETGGGTWLHPDLAIQLAQWCNPLFALQVSRWVREWMTLAYAQSEQEKKEQEKEFKERKLIGMYVLEKPSPWCKRFEDDFMEQLCLVTGRSLRAAISTSQFLSNFVAFLT